MQRAAVKKCSNMIAPAHCTPCKLGKKLIRQLALAPCLQKQWRATVAAGRQSSRHGMHAVPCKKEWIPPVFSEFTARWITVLDSSARRIIVGLAEPNLSCVLSTLSWKCLHPDEVFQGGFKVSSGTATCCRSSSSGTNFDNSENSEPFFSCRLTFLVLYGTY